MAARRRSFIIDLIRIILALVFIFSGFVKAVDPWGTAIKLGEYFAAFGMQWLEGAKYALSILLSSSELLLGLLLLFSIRIKGASFFAALFMVFFTIMTLIAALSNPVTDCGCFGDALKLTNWETFAKNLVLLPLSAILFTSVVRENSSRHDSSGEWLSAVLFALFSASIGLYAMVHLPIIDFLPYRVGVNILRDMEIPEGASEGEYRTILTYKDLETGQLREFDSGDPTWYDTLRWEFVDSRSEEISAGYVPPIGEFTIFRGGDDDTRKILESPRETYIFVIEDPGGLTAVDHAKIRQVYEFAGKTGGEVIYVTPSSLKANPFERTGMDIEGYNMDGTTMKMFLRAHKGLVVLDRGTIIAKWNMRDVPPLSKVGDTTMSGYLITKYRKTLQRDYGVVLGVMVVLVLVLRRGMRRRY